MKKILLLVLSFFFVGTAYSARTITVDNNAGAVAEFDNIADAYEAAEDGDTILLTGSSTTYGSLDCYKSLHFIGNGYFLTANNIPGLYKDPVKMNIALKENLSLGLGDSSGASVLGIWGQVTSQDTVTGVEVDKCYGVGNWVFEGPVTITRSWITGNLYLRAASSSVSNSIVTSLRIEEQNVTATHCVTTSSCFNVANSSISSTIFISASAAKLQTNANITYSINVGPDNLVPDGGFNNTTGQLLADVFTLEGGDNTKDAYYQIKEGGPADNTGNGAGTEDMGAFDGPAPYVLSGVPGIPRMTNFAVPSIATGLTALEFEASAQSFPE